MKILIVDDSAQARRFLHNLVRHLKMDVLECISGDEAVRVFDHFRPDFVTMDVMMKGISGVEATRRIIAANPAAKVIVVSAFDDRETREAAERAGACLFVAKENLIPLRRFLEEACQQAAPAPTPSGLHC